jgi:hypothetical protein
VKNQQRSAPELLQISSSERHELLNFHHSRDKPSTENFSRSARLAASFARPAALCAADSPSANAKRAFCHGIVKVQQDSAPELLQINNSERHAPLNSPQSREKSRVQNRNFQISINPVIDQALKIFHVTRVWRRASLARRRFAPLIRLWRMPNARSVTEP